uniref:Synaptophysin-like 2a n=1 Tax=Oreochromis niloticus TaxID=8128 RepID=A0A669DXA7_ORENI
MPPLCLSLPVFFCLQQVFSIFAFATIGGYTGTTHFTVSCPDKDQPVEAFFAYPFRVLPVTDTIYNLSSCTETYLQGDFSSSAQFFVCVGVFAFLYCTATLIVYLGYRTVYLQTSRGPVIDLLLTAAFAFLWLVSSSAWGKGLTDVKYATDPNRPVELCTSCKAGEFPSMGRLNASVIFGFLNLILWAGNCWFIYKDTPFHKDPAPPTTMEEGGAPGP